ncbi:MAG: hypothetical protein EBU83_05425 [bacterium]|nr:hypothetical protein [Candidatus Aquidulcis sp.]
MKVYLAGPLFNDGERGTLSHIAARLRANGVDVFVPHEQYVELEGLDAQRVFTTDLAGIEGADLLLAWLDGTQVDDGTSVEIGIFSQLCRREPNRYRGIVAVCTDLRMLRRRGLAPGDGINLFVAGAIESVGEITWSVDEAINAALRRLRGVTE